MKRYIKSIYAMSKPKTEVEMKLWHDSGNILRHIVLYLCSDNEELKKHWSNEIFNFINNVPRLKGSNKFPSAQLIYDNTYKVWYDSVDAGMPKLFKSENLPYDKQKCDEATIRAEKYFIWLANELSINGFITRQDCYNVLESL